MLAVRVAPQVEGKVRLGAVVVDSLTVTARDDAQVLAMEALAGELRRRYSGTSISEVPEVREVRSMYWRLGMDPTHRRPSSEALLRRVVRGQALPQINTLVDAINFCSLRLLLPIGLYDLDRIVGDVELRLGRPGESYEAIGREKFSIAGRLVLADARGPFGSPTSDSLRTMVTAETHRALAVLFAPPVHSSGRLDLYLDLLAGEIVRYNGGFIAERWTS